MAGLAKVAAVNCDEESNKALCGQFGVQGFPTLKIVKPGKRPGKPIVEDYQGQRQAKAIVDAVVEKIPNHVKRVKDDGLEQWLAEDNESAKAVLFTNKGTTSALLRALAIDFLGSVSIAQVRDKEKQAVEVFGVEKFPSFVVLPGGDEKHVTYDGEMKKADMVAFLSQFATPNPDPAPKAIKPPKSDKAKASKASSSFSKASQSHKSEEAPYMKAPQTSEVLEDASNPTESPNPIVAGESTEKPIKLPEVAPAIKSLDDATSLQKACLNSKSSTCILALLPATQDETTTKALSSLAEIHHKHVQSGRNIFPFYSIPNANPSGASIRNALNRGDGLELLAINGKRSWSRHYLASAYNRNSIEDWVDAIRMGEGSKTSLPDGLVVDASELAGEPVETAEAQDTYVQADGTELKMEDLAGMKGSLPEGVDFEFEEITQEELEIMMEHANAAGRAQNAAERSAASEFANPKPTATPEPDESDETDVENPAEPEPVHDEL